MTGEVVAQLAGGEVPHLNQLVPARRSKCCDQVQAGRLRVSGHMSWESPATGDYDRLSGGRREADAADPLSVALLGGASSDGELAVAEGVPQLDGLHSEIGRVRVTEAFASKTRSEILISSAAPCRGSQR